MKKLLIILLIVLFTAFIIWLIYKKKLIPKGSVDLTDKSHRKEKMQLRPRIFILKISDTKQTETADLAQQRLTNAGFPIVGRDIISHDKVEDSINNLLNDYSIDGILTIGNTGYSKTDIVIPTLEKITFENTTSDYNMNHRVPGFGERFRRNTETRWKNEEEQIGHLDVDTATAAFIINGKVVIAIPATPDAVDLGSDLAIKAFPSLYGQLLKDC